MKNHSPAAQILPFQPTLSPALPTVLGNVDYQEFERQLCRMDQLLRASGLETNFAGQCLAQYDAQFPAATTKARQRHQRHSYRALRCNILRGLLGEDFRGMSRRLAECPLFRWFCGLEELAAVRVPGKSLLQDYAHWLPQETLRPMKRQVQVVAAHARRHRQLLDKEWEATDWTRPQARQVLRRMDGVLALLPQAQKQAHERIIGERKVNNSDKLLSLYETDTQVIVRGKAGAEVEFGNTLLLAEQGRIGIFKNGFLGRPLRAKGFEHREMVVSWQVLTHNLWVLARLEQRAALAQAA